MKYKLNVDIAQLKKESIIEINDDEESTVIEFPGCFIYLYKDSPYLEKHYPEMFFEKSSDVRSIEEIKGLVKYTHEKNGTYKSSKGHVSFLAQLERSSDYFPINKIKRKFNHLDVVLRTFSNGHTRLFIIIDNGTNVHDMKVIRVAFDTSVVDIALEYCIYQDATLKDVAINYTLGRIDDSNIDVVLNDIISHVTETLKQGEYIDKDSKLVINSDYSLSIIKE